MNESCHMCRWVMARVWMSHVTQVSTFRRKATRHSLTVWQVWCLYVWHDSFICVTWLVLMMWHPVTWQVWCLYVWRDSFVCMAWHVRVIWPICVCDMTHWYVRYDSSIFATCQIICDRDVTGLISIRAVTHSKVTYMTQMYGTHTHVTYLTQMCHDSFKRDILDTDVALGKTGMLLTYMWHGSFMCDI